jgi:hypothetical protein
VLPGDQDLDRHGPIEVRLESAVDDPDRPAAEDVADLVLPDVLWSRHLPFPFYSVAVEIYRDRFSSQQSR